MLIFQTKSSIKSNNLSLKYQRFPISGCIDIGIRKFEFVAKTQFLWSINVFTKKITVKVQQNYSKNSAKFQ